VPLVIEDSLEKLATLYLKFMQAYDATHFTDINSDKFIAEQFTKDYRGQGGCSLQLANLHGRLAPVGVQLVQGPGHRQGIPA
jgi:hypothetical protein